VVLVRRELLTQLVLLALRSSLFLLVQRLRLDDHLLELVRRIAVQMTFLLISFIIIIILFVQ